MRIAHSSAATPAVSIAEVKAHCRVYDDDEDIALAAMALAATLELEAQADLALLTRTVTLRLDGWPADGRIWLPVGPVVDSATATITADGQAFTAFSILPGRRGELRLDGEVTAELAVADIVVTYPAGYGADETAVPGDLRHGILDQVAALYDMRGSPGGREAAVSPHLLRIAAKYRGARV